MRRARHKALRILYRWLDAERYRLFARRCRSRRFPFVSWVTIPRRRVEVFSATSKRGDNHAS